MGTAFSYSLVVNSPSFEGLAAKCSCLRETIIKSYGAADFIFFVNAQTRSDIELTGTHN